jgi:hypothetical protein
LTLILSLILHQLTFLVFIIRDNRLENFVRYALNLSIVAAGPGMMQGLARNAAEHETPGGF